jgi:hypothetical protein
MDGQDAYNIGHVLNPRFKSLLLENELEKDCATKIILCVKESLY